MKKKTKVNIIVKCFYPVQKENIRAFASQKITYVYHSI